MASRDGGRRWPVACVTASAWTYAPCRWVRQALVAGGLMVLERAAGVIDKLDTVADIQLETARMGQRVLGMFPPLIGKLGELVELELRAARARLGVSEEEEP